MSPETASLPCRRCGEPTCAHHELLARAFGLKGSGICFRCLGASLAIRDGELAEAVFGYVHQKDCYREEWREIGRCGLGGEGLAPACLPVAIPAAFAELGTPPGGEPETATEPAERDGGEPPEWEHDSTFDGGDAGCGDLLFDLRLAVRPLAGGTRVLVTARDPGAPVDLPAWSRLTGHRMLRAEHPHYLIERKHEDERKEA